jgi:photosystem II stability/assembly factor-like uncharacterized protein
MNVYANPHNNGVTIMQRVKITILLLLCSVTVLFSQSYQFQSNSGTLNNLYSISSGYYSLPSWTGTGYVAVGANGTIISTNNTGIWTNRSSGTTNTLYGITYGNNLYVAVGWGVIRTSPSDCITWTARTPSTAGGTNDLQGITYGNNLYVLVGYATIQTSPDGITWTSRASGTNYNLYGITYGNSKYVAVGYQGTIYSSPDGITWTGRASGTTATLYSVTYCYSLYIAVGDSGTILTSPDGIAWTKRISGTTSKLNGVTGFVAVGDGGTIITTQDGVSWTAAISNTTSTLYGVAFATNPMSAVVGAGGKVFTTAVTLHNSYTAPKLNYSVVGKTMQIYTLQGKLISQKQIESETCFDGKNSTYKNLPKGMYIVRIPTGNISRRVLVE